MIAPDLIFLALIAIAVAIGLMLQWLDRRQADRDRKRRLDDIMGRRP